MKIKDIVKHIEELAPLAYQESYDNAGLMVGAYSDEVEAALITFDITEEIIDEAIELNAGLVIAHHPIVFSGLKKLNGNNMVERCVIKAIRNNIALYAAHTNIDNVNEGVNHKICSLLNLQECKILAPISAQLSKLVVFVPTDKANIVRQAMFAAGAGSIGEYDNCSFNSNGEGTFLAKENANPYVGEIGQEHHEPEVRIETIVPNIILNKVVSAMVQAHPYEEVAYDIYELKNKLNTVGAGMIGKLSEPIDEMEFLKLVKEKFNAGCVKYSPLLNKKIQKVAVCGGSGSFLIGNAIGARADVFITGDIKYHDFFRAENKIVLADIGHYESEQYTKNIIYDLLMKKISKFALHLSKLNSNPVNYL